MASCTFCPRYCQERTFGFCKAKDKFEVAWWGKHFGEEPPISGDKGSGTIFFGRCNLKCVYCQNWQISQEDFSGKFFSQEELLKLFFELQNQGCQNINLVSPTVWSGRLIPVLEKAKGSGLKIPIVWNTNAYESVEILKSLSGLVDIFLPDYKYDDDSLGLKYSQVSDYSKVARKAILTMFSLVGPQKLIVRHLILPGETKNTLKCLKFIRSLSPQIQLSLMAQYNPLYKAKNFPKINRKLTKQEYDLVLKEVKDLDFEEGWIQEFDQSVVPFTPDFNKEKPF